MIAEDDNTAVYQVTENSRRVAAAAQQDSSTMKNIALLTMLYLPGSFVASLFSMPLFDWDEARSSWRGRLALYLAVAGPLTLITLFLWAVLIRVQRHRRGNVSEVGRLISRREPMVKMLHEACSAAPSDLPLMLCCMLGPSTGIRHHSYNIPSRIALGGAWVDLLCLMHRLMQSFSQLGVANQRVDT